jgi:hypothetical protein
MYILFHQGQVPLRLIGEELMMGNRRKVRDIECVTIEYEGSNYDVVVGMEVEEVEEVFVVDGDTDISPVMRKSVIDWMLEKAVEEIEVMRSEPAFIDMNWREREIEGY